MKGWDDALEMQNELRASFHTVTGTRYMQNFERSLNEPGKMFSIEKGVVESVSGDATTANEAVSAAIATVEAGVPMWVSEEVIDLVEFAAETWQPEALMPDHLFTYEPVFAYLERPLETIDVNGRTAAFRALSWAICSYEGNVGKQGLVVALWSHCDDADDYSDAFTPGARLVGGSHLSLMHSGNIPFGVEKIMRESGHRALAVQLQVMSRLAKQEVIVPGRERTSRPVWRRKSNWRQIKEVTVLRLRRAKRPKYEGEERDVEWTHRWWVTGHWRNQWYPTLQQHCQIWIDGHIKGPDDKPFVPKKHAIEFTR